MFDPKLAIEWLTAKQALCLEMELPLTDLVAELYEYVDQFSEHDYPGLSDYLALYAELLESLEEDQLNKVIPVIQRLSLQLTQLFNTSPELAAMELVSCLNNSQWPEPLPDEDGELLLELLEADCGQLSSVGRTDKAVNVDEPPLAAQSEEAEESLVALKPSASVLKAFPNLFLLLEQIGDSLPTFTEEHTEQFYEEIDIHSENDWSGISDLLALYGELLAQLEEVDNASFANELNHAILTFLSQPAETPVKTVLALMSDSRWPEPVAEEDTEFLYDLLIEDIERLDSLPLLDNAVADTSANAETDIEPVELIKEVIEVEGSTDEVTDTSSDTLRQIEDEAPKLALPEPPAFCSIDFTLLQQEGPQIEPAVLTMLSQSVSALSGRWHEPAVDRSLLNESAEILSTVIRALETINLVGVKVLVNGLILNLNYLSDNDIDLSVEIIESLQACLSGLEEYFVDISIYERQQTLLDQYLDTQLPCKPNAEQGSFIMGLLALASLQSAEDIEQETAEPEDVELQESSEIDPQLLDMLHNELPTLCDDFLNQLQKTFTDSDEEALRSAKRSVHTLKGLANMAGIKGLANLAHRLEDVMEYLADADKLPTGRLQAELLEAADCLAAMSETVTEGASAPDNAVQVLQLIMDWDYRLKTDGLDALDASNDSSGAPTPDRSVESGVPAEAAIESEEVSADTARNESPVFRVPRTVLDNLFRLAGESSTLNTQLDEEVTQLRGFTRSNRERHRILQRVLFELEQQFHEQMNVQSQLDENSEDFDPLEMDRYNEIHTTISRVHEAVADVREVQQEMEGHIQSLSSLHMAQSGLQKETLTNVLSTRLVPVKTITSRLQRILRQACRATDKQAHLIVKGEDTQVDSHILNQLADPLMHIIRNAVDHGLETARLRQQRGKPAEGTITLTFSMQDSLIDVKCEDDGDGINAQRVLAVAAEKELIESDVELSDDEINRLILIPGFSTRGEVSQLSGRGIGMDVVYQQILRLQGTLNIESRPREGTLLHLSMPASSLMIRTLLVRCGKQVFALAGHGVEQSLISLDGQLKNEGGTFTFQHENETYPVYMLENLLDERGYDYLESGAIHPVLIINMGQGERVALLVKEIIAHRELAFKQMGDFIPDIPGLPGLTILANGEAAPIVDLPSRIRYLRSSLYEKPLLVDLDTELELPRLLVVDDSLSARKTLETLLKDTGYEVMTAIDGLDALNQIRKRQPDLVITDMEMPRMGGVELSTVLSNRDETSEIPVIMITSRSTEKHRNEALEAGISAYLTKPWSENQLLDQIDNLLAETCV
ncbi:MULTISPECIES: response regulator [unclassified Neptuniibacter]|uniref:response regulator n=1 Tax=unclassified Neptuniibacter TaxID=2630693 RepID=UPI000C5D3E1A|nr:MULTISPECIES: response regulator [unclassified Neptuniibacter]MAY42898.1 hybrid sensor histidine kinase/response regulator [Oceanospirillaceae bacterium]|tara:strand:- start:11317 stop:15207 length:3891 start_codon:yes stop_codon:yes gene_type:complete